MDLHEEDKEHLINAHNSAIEVVKNNADWIKIDCENDWKMKSVEEINKNILNLILEN